LDEHDSDLDDSDDSDDEDDDEAALEAELAKIRAEREALKQKEKEEAEAKEDLQLEEAALIGNPLLSTEGGSGKLKRKWNDDVVFRNQAKGEPEVKKRFINDTIRNDFHKRFLNKFVR
jgi:protein CWC15